MTDAIKLALITSASGVLAGAIPGTIAAMAAASARRAAERAEILAREIHTKTVETARAINGRMDEMLALAKAAAFREGVLKAKEDAEKISAAVREAKSS